MKKTPYTYHQDPSHGWLAVPRARLNALGILLDISRYSYQRRDYVFLEEDCDLARFVHALRARNIQPDFVEVFADPCPIRDYDRFDPEVDPCSR